MRLLRWIFVCSTFYRAIGAALSPNDTRSEKQIPKFVALTIQSEDLGSSQVEYKKKVVELNLSNQAWGSTTWSFQISGRAWFRPLPLKPQWSCFPIEHVDWLLKSVGIGWPFFQIPSSDQFFLSDMSYDTLQLISDIKLWACPHATRECMLLQSYLAAIQQLSMVNRINFWVANAQSPIEATSSVLFRSFFLECFRVPNRRSLYFY